MADLPFLSGKDATLRLYMLQTTTPSGGVVTPGPEVILNAKTWNIKREGVKASDGVNGEPRDRLLFITNYFSIGSECFVNRAAQLDALINDMLNDDAGVPPFVKQGAMRLSILDGSRAPYTLGGLCIDDWDVKQGGRSERLMLGLPMRFTTLKKGKNAVQ